MLYGKKYGGAAPQLIEGDIFRMIVSVPDFVQHVISQPDTGQQPMGSQACRPWKKLKKVLHLQLIEQDGMDIKFKFDDNYVPAESASAVVLAAMLYPNDADMQTAWLVKYWISRLDMMHIHYKHEFNFTDDEAYEAVSRDYIWIVAKSLGGFHEYKKIILDRSKHTFKDETKMQAVKGLLVGKILMYAIDNGGNVSQACVDAIEHYIVVNETWRISSIHKYDDPEYIRQKYWYPYSKVAHLWAAANHFFKHAPEFADIIYFDFHPFSCNSQHKTAAEGVSNFLDLAMEYYEKATSIEKKSGKAWSILPKETCMFTPHHEK